MLAGRTPDARTRVVPEPEDSIVTAVVFAALGAFINALTSVLQRIGVETAPEASALKASLIGHAVRQKVWLIGFGFSLVYFGLVATALKHGELSTVQPVLTTELVFLLLILGIWFRYHLGVREWLGCLVVVAGLGGFFLAARPHGGQELPSTGQWVVATVGVAVAIGLGVLGGLRGPRWWRAASLGAATAVAASYTSVLTKAITSYLDHGWSAVFSHFQPYMLTVVGFGTIFLLQSALHAGPITASRTTLITLNPLVSIVFGITMFGDILRGGALWISFETAGLAVLVAGVVILTRSPLVAGSPDGGVEDEKLGGARQRAISVAPTEAIF
jgi:drug/metabolite transporter (DMT)-like permease